MSGYLLDTNVISMLSPARAEALAAFPKSERMDAGGRLLRSVVTIREIEADREKSAAPLMGATISLIGTLAQTGRASRAPHQRNARSYAEGKPGQWDRSVVTVQ